ncbi:MAG TPA: MFS transporter [Porticoccaceae bacterium]|nr:MFS transporter [Porticoccaceae bacterium]
MATSYQDAPERSMRRVALTALAGTSIEWFDFFIYGMAAALVFPAAFFPEDMPELVSLIAAFGTFAVGFIARPIGGMIFGHFGDRIGRKATLVSALMLMGVATTLIGVLPTYASIGIAAPLLLTLLRFAQGLAVGGQWGGAMLLVTENAPANRRGYYGAFAQAGAPVGMILANLAFLGVSAVISDQQFQDWGWRIPFLASIVLIGLSMYVQLHLEETPAFKELQDFQAKHSTESGADVAATEQGEAPAPAKPRLRNSPVLQAIASHPRQILLAAGAFIAVQVTFYILVVFVVAYGTQSSGLNLPREFLLTAILISSFVQIAANFGAAIYSDRSGRRGIYMAGAILGGIWAFALFPLIDTGSFLWITVAISVAQIFMGLMYGPQAALLAELFSTHVRYSGASLGYQLGAILGGALAPMIATALWHQFGVFYVAVYIAVASVLTLISVIMLSETSGRNLQET